MRRTIRKLIIGKGQSREAPRRSTTGARWTNFLPSGTTRMKRMPDWRRLVRLFLSLSQFLFPGMYIKHLFWRKGPCTRFRDGAVRVEDGLPVGGDVHGREQEPAAFWVAIWLMLETVMYIPTSHLRFGPVRVTIIVSLQAAAVLLQLPGGGVHLQDYHLGRWGVQPPSRIGRMPFIRAS
ncbi:MAG: hypothetical protein R2815_10110 [Flavobacteriales bacterium]